MKPHQQPSTNPQIPNSTYSETYPGPPVSVIWELWIQVRFEQEPTTIYVMVSRNYKVHATRKPDSHGERPPIFGVIKLTIDVEDCVKAIGFNVAEGLTTEVMIGWNYFHGHVEAIRPRKQNFELDDGTIVTIIKDPDKNPPEAVLPRLQERYAYSGERLSRRIKATEKITFNPEFQTWVTISTNWRYKITVEPWNR